MSQTLTADSVDFDKIQTSRDLLDTFINIAKTCPKQMDELFKKYVQDIQKDGYSYETSEFIAIRCLRLLADSRGAETYSLICRTIPAMRFLLIRSIGSKRKVPVVSHLRTRSK